MAIISFPRIGFANLQARAIRGIPFVEKPVQTSVVLGILLPHARSLLTHQPEGRRPHEEIKNAAGETD
jgi:hypothetical protein